ncbi:hypothetical protein GQ457_17G005020 [Hibiscus cannabinus]
MLSSDLWVEFNKHLGPMLCLTEFMVGDAEIVYVLRYFHGGIFKTSPKFEYENGMMERFQVDPDKLFPTEEFNCDGLVLIHNDDTVRQVI